MVRFVYFCAERELSANYFFDQGLGKPSLFPKARPLGRGEAGHDERPIEVRFDARFKEKRDIHESPGMAATVVSRQCRPARPDCRMHNRFEGFAGNFVRKDHLAEAGPAHATIGIESFTSEGLTHCGNDRLIVREQFMDAPVGVENFRRQMPKQRFDRAGFACGDSAGDSQNGHGQSGRRPVVT